MEQYLGTNEEPAENLWVRISGHINVTDIGVDICYKLHDEEEEANN